MTDLSPAAAAVLKEYESSWTADPFEMDIGVLAGALRAAAEQIENMYCDADVEDSPGVVFALRRLLLIAAALEAFAS
jgi:hypothetical protein